MIFSENRKAKFDYEILKKFTAGLVLLGWEVKQIRSGRFDISNSYIKLENQSAILKNSIVPIPKYAVIHDKKIAERSRILLLSRREIDVILTSLKQGGVTFVPLKVFSDDKNLIKMECAVVKGMKKYDKRQKEKIKDIKKAVSRNF